MYKVLFLLLSILLTYAYSMYMQVHVSGLDLRTKSMHTIDIIAMLSCKYSMYQASLIDLLLSKRLTSVFLVPFKMKTAQTMRKPLGKIPAKKLETPPSFII